MKIKTKFHDQIEITDKDILTFPKGIPGFEDEKHFVLLDLMEPGTYKVLQSLKKNWVAFIMVSPWLFKSDYEFDLPESALELLEVKTEKDIDVYNLLTIPKELKNTTMNLMAPVVIQQRKRLGMQVVLENVNYSTKYPIQIEGC